MIKVVVPFLLGLLLTETSNAFSLAPACRLPRRLSPGIQDSTTAANNDPAKQFRQNWVAWIRQAVTGPAPSSRGKSVADNTNRGVRELMELISETPSNAPTPYALTQDILDVVRQLEQQFSSQWRIYDGPSSSQQLQDYLSSKVSGTWDLVWTAQDRTSKESRFNWINPIENQAYSNNPFAGNGSGDQPLGRANPVLPRPVQDALENLGWIETENAGINENNFSVKSTQAIDIQSQQIRNVVTFGIRSLGGGSGQQRRGSKLSKTVRASISVTIDFDQDELDAQKTDVKFQKCRVVIPALSIDWTIPLGFAGPSGWIKTTYVDDTVRITRGHKGSVFILQRPSATLAAARAAA